MLLNIDYLILNFKGSLDYRKNYVDNVGYDVKPFHLEQKEYGTKVFKNAYDLFYCNERVGQLFSVPRSNVIDKELIQFQFENHLFYSNTLSELGEMVTAFVNYYACDLHSINRLDICLDTKENSIKYRNLYNDLNAGTLLLKGREKQLASYGKTAKGRGLFTGFTVGKRSAARFLRVYNKTHAILLDEGKKDYITDWHNRNGLTASAGLDIWRFEYQLNNKFFADKAQINFAKEGETQPITWQIFNYQYLVDLFNYARTNHFEVVYNTGKTETNKERIYDFIDFSKLKRTPFLFVARVSRKKQLNTLTSVKRVCKGLFRMYYTKQSTAYLFTMHKLLTENSLMDWFKRKYDFYVHEFRDKEKQRGYFNEFAFSAYFNMLDKQIINITTQYNYVNN